MGVTISHDNAKLKGITHYDAVASVALINKSLAMGRPKKQRELVPGTLAYNVDRFMKAHGLSQTQWAKNAQISEGSLRRLLDTSNAEFETLQKLAQGAGDDVTIMHIIDGVSPKDQAAENSIADILRTALQDFSKQAPNSSSPVEFNWSILKEVIIARFASLLVDKPWEQADIIYQMYCERMRDIHKAE